MQRVQSILSSMTMAAQTHTQLTWHCMKDPKIIKNGIFNTILMHLFLFPVTSWHEYLIPDPLSLAVPMKFWSSTSYYLGRSVYLLAFVPFSLPLPLPPRTFLWYGDSIPKGLYSLVGVRPKRCRDRVCGVTGEFGDSFFRR